MGDTDREAVGLQTRVLHESNRLNETHAVTPPIRQTPAFGADSTERIAEPGESIDK